MKLLPPRAATILRTLADTVRLGAEWLSLEMPTPPRKARALPGRHLALLAAWLPPSSNAGVHRPLSFMRYGCRLGWRIDAFCSQAARGQSEHGEELLSRVPREASLHVVPLSTLEPSYRLTPRVDGGFANALAYARYAIETMRKDPPDVVLASGPPFFTFVSALFVARRFGVPLVLDYRDEWTECPFDFVSKGANDRDWERRCLRHADVVMFTTASHRQHQLSIFPELAPHKVHVVPNGWEPNDFGDLPREEAAADATNAATVRIAHVGTLGSHTPPHEFLDALQRLITDQPEQASRMRVQLIGRRSPGANEAIRMFGFPAVLEVIEHVGKSEANRRMQDSDVLLLITNPDLERYLPGKLFDYVAARRPILVFGSRGESSELIEKLGVGVFCESGSAQALRDALVRLQNLDMSRNRDSVDRWLLEHRRETLAMRTFGIIDSIAS